MAKPDPGLGENRILAALPRADYARLSPHLQRVEIVTGAILQEEAERQDHVFFPESGILSLVSSLENGEQIEVAGVGNEGMVGVSVFLGVPAAPIQVISQVPGTALRLTAARLHEETQRGGALYDRLGRYVHALLITMGQTIACNRFHDLDSRCARWLLTAHDRVGGDDFVLTHQFLAMMLGVRRAGVSTIAGRLQKSGVISYSQGHVSVRDRKALEAASCECYGVVREQLEIVFRDLPLARSQ